MESDLVVMQDPLAIMLFQRALEDINDSLSLFALADRFEEAGLADVAADIRALDLKKVFEAGLEYAARHISGEDVALLGKKNWWMRALAQQGPRRVATRCALPGPRPGSSWGDLHRTLPYQIAGVVYRMGANQFVFEQSAQYRAGLPSPTVPDLWPNWLEVICG